MVALSPTIKFADLPGECERLGLIVLGTRVRYEGDNLVVEVVFSRSTTAGEPVVIIGKEEIENKLKEDMKPKDLRTILSDLLREAAKDPETPQRAFLRGGLRVDAMVSGSTVHFQISRQGIDPSETEWKTTLKYLPYPIPDGPTRAFTHEGRWYRASEWPIPEQPKTR